MSKLIVIRGLSASGKTTVAKAVQEHGASNPLLFSQDYFKDHLFGEKDGSAAAKETVDIEHKRILMFGAVTIALLELNRDVIIEGIMGTNTYLPYFEKLLAVHPEDNHFFFVKVPLEQTIERHKGRDNRGFGEKEMREWHERSAVRLPDRYNEKEIVGPPNVEDKALAIEKARDEILQLSKLAIRKSVVVQMPIEQEGAIILDLPLADDVAS